MVLEFPFGLEKFMAFTVEEEEEKKRERREVQEFKVWILVNELYGICAWKYLIETMCLEWVRNCV